MRRTLIFLGVLLLAIIAQLVVYYRGPYIPPTLERMDFGGISVQKAPVAEFRDEFVPAQGTVVFDMAHYNYVDARELRVLVSRLIARGYKVEYLEKGSDLREALKYAGAFVVISPGNAYSKEDVDFLSRFVEKKGRLLFIHDPTRSGSINSVSIGFGVIFDSGYLYNQVENDGNYQYIFLRDFGSNGITKELSKVSMYAASSITSTGTALVYSDNNTFSSTQPKQRYTPMVLAAGGNVLALGDLSFMLEPYNSLFDNNKLISNIADFLSSSVRVFHVTDYPYYLGDSFFVVYSDEALLEDALKIKNRIGRKSTLRVDDPGVGNTVVLGLYNSTAAKKYLGEAGIVAADKLEIKGVGKVEKNGSFIIVLTQSAGRNVLLIASDENDGIASAVSSLSKIDEITLTENVAYSIYSSKKTGTIQEPIPAQAGQSPGILEQRPTILYSLDKALPSNSSVQPR